MRYIRYGIESRKMKHRTHTCACCGEELWIIEHSKVLNIRSKEAKYYSFWDFDGHILGDCTFIHDIFRCLKSNCEACNKNVEPDTQLSIEDTDIMLKKVEESFHKKGFNISIKKLYLTHTDEINDKLIVLDEVKEIHLYIYLDGGLIGKFKSPILRLERYERPYYLKVCKRQLVRYIKKLLKTDTNPAVNNNEEGYTQKAENRFIKFLKKYLWWLIVLAFFVWEIYSKR